MKIGILLIATNKYKQFVGPLAEQIRDKFLPSHDVTIFLFTDERGYFNEVYNEPTKVVQIIIPPYRFPLATLYRYKIFDENKAALSAMDYLYYMDVDMAVVDTVGDEILFDGIMNVLHPGGYANPTDGGIWGKSTPPNSMAFVPHDKRTRYVCGGFQGGRTKEFLEACNILNARIQADEANGCRAEHNDETHWNWLNKSGLFQTKTLTPTYCMVEEPERRIAWGLSHLPVKIVAITKDHKAIRE